MLNQYVVFVNLCSNVCTVVDAAACNSFTSMSLFSFCKNAVTVNLKIEGVGMLLRTRRRILITKPKYLCR